MAELTRDELSMLFERRRFEAALGSDFELRADPEIRVALRLYEVTARPAPRGYEQYSALFRAPAEPVLAQGTYAIRHPDFGEFPLFIVPISRDADAVTYEACVVRRADSPDAAQGAG